MKFYLILLLLTSIYCSTCPNNCSGHGTCSKSICLCYEGYTFGDCSGKTCPFGKTYVEPGASATADDQHTDLECSGKGNCNRNNGLCECYEGYEGSACQRTSCPNNCNSHGVCVPVTHLNLNNNQYSNVYDKTASPYDKWDKDQSYACVCDGEYEGYDCSEKKCPVGYSATSDCEESSSESTITVKIAANKLIVNELVYLEYTDMYGRKWYSDKFNPLKTGDGSDYGWNYALRRLPVGVIDYKGVTLSTTGDTVTIHFGNQQSGRQGNIKIITYKDIEDDTGKLYPGANTPSGYHGMSIEDLKVAYTGNVDYTLASATTSDFIVTSSGVPASVCSGNGSCMTDTGLCECFDGFYGNACSLTESSM